MDNLEYLQSIGVTDPEVQQECLAAMAKYGDNKWWQPDVDPRTFAYYQLHEPLQLSVWERFHEALMLLLGRRVYNLEVGTNAKGLKQEAQQAWNILQM